LGIAPGAVAALLPWLVAEVLDDPGIVPACAEAVHSFQGGNSVGSAPFAAVVVDVADRVDDAAAGVFLGSTTGRGASLGSSGSFSAHSTSVATEG
jgi:hypothetical protein